MIIKKIDDVLGNEFAYSKNLTTAFKFIKSHDLLSLPLGKTVIDGDDVYLNRLEYVAKDINDCKIEGHKNYLDIQLVLSGSEYIGYVDDRKEGLIVTSEYNEIKDKANYSGELDGQIILRPGFFALVYPHDLHEPMIKANDQKVEKAVIKIKIDW